MIAHLTGTLISHSLDRIILDVHGVGYEVLVPVGTQGRLQASGEEKISIHIYTSVREDAIQLFGFGTMDEKRVFEKVISVSGVGPKLGLSIVSHLPPAELVQAIETNDVRALTAVSGIGKKTAQRLILELKSKIDDFTLDAIAPSTSDRHQLLEDLRSALQNLGYKDSAIEPILDALSPKAEEEGADFNELLRESLKLLR